MARLTDCEITVLNLTASGKEVKQIADILACSVNNVKFHRSNIITKLAVNNMYEAVAVYSKKYYTKV